jgi:hypothetical protein
MKMKKIARILSLIVLAGIATFYMGCKGGDDPEPSETDAQIEKLNGTWKVSAATFEGGAPDLDHSNMAITITGSTGSKQVSYTVAGRPAGPSSWPSSGTLEFGTNVKQDLIREDDINISYTVTDSKLTMDYTFNIQPYTSTGRVESVSGQWHFEFSKQ